ncbi:MAG: nuclear transport factor 2 family protein [Acidobacteriia bacterium]|nr:nuclear transport factor 2 family protein [Terriglobia bacterium]
MTTKLLSALLCVLLLGCATVLLAEEPTQAEAERYIIESERQWAESVASGDPSAIERILADDFVGVDPEGRMYDKATMVADTRNAPKVYLSNHLNEVKVRFFGPDTAVAQGSETWERRTGEPKRGRFVWTDTWIRRNQKWQIVAAEDLIAPEVSH